MNNAKLAKARANIANNKVAKVEFVDSNEVYKRLRDVNERFSESNKINKEFLEEVQEVVSNALGIIAGGIKVTNLEDIKIEQSFTTPPVIVPEIKAPVVNVPKPTIIKQDNIFDIYKPADTDEENSVKYYGYLAKDGKWFIMSEINSGESKKYRYASGKDNYNFSKRQKLSYDYIDKVEI